MRALVYHGKQDIRCENVPDPKIEKPRDAIVKVTSCAICGSDLHLYDGFVPGMMSGQTHVNRWSDDLLCRIADGQIDPSFVITRTVSLEDGRDCYRIFRDKEDGCVKVVLKPGAAS